MPASAKTPHSAKALRRAVGVGSRRLQLHGFGLPADGTWKGGATRSTLRTTSAGSSEPEST